MCLNDKAHLSEQPRSSGRGSFLRLPSRSFWRISSFARRRLLCEWVPMRAARIRLPFCTSFTAKTSGWIAATAIRGLRPESARICPRRRTAWIATACRSPKIPESRSWIRRWPPLRHTPGSTSPCCRSTWCSTTGYTRPPESSVRIATAVLRAALPRRPARPAVLLRRPTCTAARISACRCVSPATGAKRSNRRISGGRPRTAPHVTGSLWIGASS